jgi:hypothetical protein
MRGEAHARSVTMTATHRVPTHRQRTMTSVLTGLPGIPRTPESPRAGETGDPSVARRSSGASQKVTQACVTLSLAPEPNHFVTKMRVSRAGTRKVGPVAVADVMSSSRDPEGKPRMVVSVSPRLMATYTVSPVVVIE